MRKRTIFFDFCTGNIFEPPLAYRVIIYKGVKLLCNSCALRVKVEASGTTPALERLAVCSSAVWLWFLHNGLQLNADKSEVVILGTGHQLRATANITAVEVAGSNLIVSDRLKSLGVTIDSHLRFDCHAMLRGHATTTRAPNVTYAYVTVSRLTYTQSADR